VYYNIISSNYHKIKICQNFAARQAVKTVAFDHSNVSLKKYRATRIIRIIWKPKFICMARHY
jgi:hypothetical protein